MRIVRRWFPAAVIAVAVLYGSLIPFRIDDSRLRWEAAATDLLPLCDTTPEDVLINVSLYAVLAGALLISTLHRRLIDAFVIVVLSAVFSLSIETLQFFLPQRVSSSTDVLLNVFGALVGVVLSKSAFPWTVRTGRRLLLTFSAQPYHALSLWVSVGLLAFHLAPFDFVLQTGQLHDSFRRVRLFGHAWGSAGFVGELYGAAWFGFLGWLVGRAVLQTGRSPLFAWGAGFQHGVLMAILIETLQVFSRSHVGEAGAAMLRGMAAMVGSWTAVFTPAHESEPPGRNAGRLFSTPSVLVAAGLQVGLLLATLIRQGDMVVAHRPTLCLPFESLWRQPLPLAAFEALSVVVTSGFMAWTLAVVFRRIGLPSGGLFSSTATMTIYLVKEGLDSFLSGGSFDGADVLLAAGTCAVVSCIRRWTARWDTQVPVLANASTR